MIRSRYNTFHVIIYTSHRIGRDGGREGTYRQPWFANLDLKSQHCLLLRSKNRPLLTNNTESTIWYFLTGRTAARLDSFWRRSPRFLALSHGPRSRLLVLSFVGRATVHETRRLPRRNAAFQLRPIVSRVFPRFVRQSFTKVRFSRFDGPACRTPARICSTAADRWSKRSRTVRDEPEIGRGRCARSAVGKATPVSRST